MKARHRRARLASKYSHGTAAQVLGSFGFQIYDMSPCPQGTTNVLTTELIECISVSIQIDMQ